MMYYDDPLQAAWMAREFGVKFTKVIDQSWHNRTTGHGESGDFYEISFGYFEKLDRIYIHPDSEVLFEPQSYDKGILYHWVCGEIAGIFDGKDWLYMNRSPDAIICDNEEEDPIRLHRIFERDGKAFFMPKVEA